ncbi:hypothetical protein TRFO_37335 [Tritrichomonas foetus]|uniref:Uncharacterized protein n=1 Tax=Tritrichomonas foetus TaxID=1144522 RepID=A0A1J4JDW2_9EUKA|nr:hypothetical protein TRFO_37335 [Tritrichomonas foetus]|eukprot:OHS96479.1 hypothetical protein TRFO_37335 [Tritrichomonas foetus]
MRRNANTPKKSNPTTPKSERKAHKGHSLGRLPKNEAAIKLAKELELRNSCQMQVQRDVDREARQRYLAALSEARLKRAEKKIVTELSKIEGLEHQIQLDKVKTMRGKDVLSRTYMVEARYDEKQRNLNQMLIDDRMHPRYSQPQPMKMPHIHTSPNHSYSEDDY